MGSPSYQAPDYAQANREAIQTSIQNLPVIEKMNNAAQLGTPVALTENELRQLGLSPADYPQDNNGNYIYSDLTGQGSAQQTQAQLQNYLTAINTTTPALLNLQQQYGTKFGEAARAQNQAANPEQFAAMQKEAALLQNNPYEVSDASLRDAISNQYQQQINAGTQLTPDQMYAVQQASRQGQAARGMAYGGSGNFQETLNALNYGTGLQQQRMQNAQNWLQSGQTTGSQKNANTQNYISGLQGFQTSSPATNSQVQSSTQGANASASQLNPSTIAQSAASIYGTDANVYNTNVSNSVNPLSMATSLGSSYLLGRK